MRFSVGANLVFAPFPEPCAHFRIGRIQDSEGEYKIQRANTKIQRANTKIQRANTRFAPTENCPLPKSRCGRGVTGIETRGFRDWSSGINAFQSACIWRRIAGWGRRYGNAKTDAHHSDNYAYHCTMGGNVGGKDECQRVFRKGSRI